MAKVFRRASVWVLCGGVSLFVLGGLFANLVMQGPATAARQLQLQLRTERATLTQERSELEAERAETVSLVRQAERVLLTERAARLELEKILTSVQSELGRTQDQLAFFEDLLPSGPHGALDIRAVDIEQHAEGLRYRILLMRSGKVTKHFVGALQFVATGHCRGEVDASEQMIILQPLLAEPAQDALKGGSAESQQTLAQQARQQVLESQRAALRLDFAQFLRGQGLLALPPRFAPKSVTVRVLEGDIILASKVVAL
jgi:hypothetical protein